MAILDKAQLKAKIDALINTNGANAITGAVHNEVLNDVVDSLANLITDVSSLGFYQYDTAKAYGINELTWYDGNFYISKVATTGAFSASDWLQLTSLTPQSNFNLSFPAYNAGSTYNIGDGVLYNNQYFICDVNGTTGITPDDAAAEWSLVYAHNGDALLEWQAGYYLQGQIITFNNKQYYLTADTSTGAYNSTSDPVTDSANWEQFNQSAGIAGTPNNMIKFGAGGAQEETDEIKVNGTAVEIKTLLKLLVGAIIQTDSDNTDLITTTANDSKLLLDSFIGGMFIRNNLAYAGAGPNFGGIGNGQTSIAVLADDGKVIMTGAGFGTSQKIFDCSANGVYTYIVPTGNGTIALIEDTIQQQLENVTGALALIGAYQQIPAAQYTTGPEGNWRITFEAWVRGSGDFIADFDLFLNGVAQGPGQGTFRSIASSVTGAQTNSADTMISITKTLTGVAGGTLIDIQGQVLAGAAEVFEGIFRVEKMP